MKEELGLGLEQEGAEENLVLGEDQGAELECRQLKNFHLGRLRK